MPKYDFSDEFLRYDRVSRGNQVRLSWRFRDARSVSLALLADTGGVVATKTDGTSSGSHTFRDVPTDSYTIKVSAATEGDGSFTFDAPVLVISSGWYWILRSIPVLPLGSFALLWFFVGVLPDQPEHSSVGLAFRIGTTLAGLAAVLASLPIFSSVLRSIPWVDDGGDGLLVMMASSAARRHASFWGLLLVSFLPLPVARQFTSETVVNEGKDPVTITTSQSNEILYVLNQGAYHLYPLLATWKRDQLRYFPHSFRPADISGPAMRLRCVSRLTVGIPALAVAQKDPADNAASSATLDIHASGTTVTRQEATQTAIDAMTREMALKADEIASYRFWSFDLTTKECSGAEIPEQASLSYRDPGALNADSDDLTLHADLTGAWGGLPDDDVAGRMLLVKRLTLPFQFQEGPKEMRFRAVDAEGGTGVEYAVSLGYCNPEKECLGVFPSGRPWHNEFRWAIPDSKAPFCDTFGWAAAFSAAPGEWTKNGALFNPTKVTVTCGYAKEVHFTPPGYDIKLPCGSRAFPLHVESVALDAHADGPAGPDCKVTQSGALALTIECPTIAPVRALSPQIALATPVAAPTALPSRLAALRY